MRPGGQQQTVRTELFDAWTAKGLNADGAPQCCHTAGVNYWARATVLLLWCCMHDIVAHVVSCRGKGGGGG